MIVIPAKAGIYTYSKTFLTIAIVRKVFCFLLGFDIKSIHIEYVFLKGFFVIPAKAGIHKNAHFRFLLSQE
jgi:hypothetical protein